MSERPHHQALRPVEVLLAASGLLSVFTTIGILLVLGLQTFRFFQEVSFAQFFLDTRWTPMFTEQHFGIWPLLFGTMLTTLIAVAFAAPVGLLAATYLSEFAAPGERRLLKPAVEVLAGVPTVVYGFFALHFVTPALQAIIPGVAGFNALSAGLVMGVMIVPTVASLSDDALGGVSPGLREAAWGLGAGKATTIWRVLFPAAWSGLVASIVLGFSRALGETMIVVIAAGSLPSMTLDPRSPVETMTTYIVNVSLGDTPAGTLEYRTIFAVGATLFLLTLVLNVLANRLARRFREGKVA